jgi:tetratricopeptide (TPR) repeat protein
MSGADHYQSPLSRPVALSSVIESHLEKILGSDAFTTVDSLRRLLSFVVHETVAGRGDDVKEYSLGVCVLGKGDSFDPKADPIVRVQMRRLRERLARYYATEGRNDPLFIDIPKGRYVPAFRPAAAGGVASAPPIDEATLMVGHQEVMAALESALDSAAAGEGRLFCLAGEPGIGKTTVVELFLRRLSTSGVRCAVGRGRCSERLVGTDAYLPVLEALESVVQGGGEPALRLIRDLAPTWYLQIGPRTEDAQTGAGRPENSAASQERLKREFVALLKGLAREHPVVLFLDDLHWADASTVDALGYAAPRCRSDRVLIVGTYRPAELLAANQAFLRVKLELQGHGVCRELPMALLTRADVDRYVSLQFPGHRFPPELAARVHARTEGNPLFMADLVRFLRDRGVLTQRDGHWVMVGELDEVEHELPESVRSMVQKKIAELAGDDRKLMSAAAVLGPRFDSAVVARALAMDAADVEDRLEALDRASGFVRLIAERVLPDSTLTLEYGFVHVLYQNALYDALTPTRKAALSLALGEALMAVSGGQAADLASQLAWLFEVGRDFARASDFFLLASQNAGRLYASEQAIALARQSIVNAEKLDGRDRHARVMAAALQSAVQHQSVTRPDAALADYGLAERAAAALGDPVAQVKAIFGQAVACFLAKRIPEVKECGTRALDIARAAGSDGAVAASTAILAMERFCSGDVAVAEQQFDEAIPVLRHLGWVPHALTAVLMRGLLHTWRLEHREAETALEWARGRAGELHANFELLIATWHQARARGNQGRLSEAWDMLEDARRLAELLGDHFWHPRIANTRGWLLAELLDTEAALRLNTEAVRVAREFGDIEAECNSHINAARDYLTLGEPHNAWTHLQQAAARYQDDVWFRWVYYPRLQAEMAGYWLAQGDLRQAQTCAQVSLDDAVRTSSRKRIVLARQLLGEIALLHGRPDDARREFASALALLDRYSCPTIEWRVLRSAADAAGALEGENARRDFLHRAGAIVHSLAGSLRDPRLETTFRRSKPIRELLDISHR